MPLQAWRLWAFARAGRREPAGQTLEPGGPSSGGRAGRDHAADGM